MPVGRDSGRVGAGRAGAEAVGRGGGRRREGGGEGGGGRKGVEGVKEDAKEAGEEGGKEEERW